MGRVFKSKFKPGQTVFARTHRSPGKSFLIKLIRYIPNYEWYADYIDTETGKVVFHHFDERHFD